MQFGVICVCLPRTTKTHDTMNNNSEFNHLLHEAGEIFHILMYGFFISLIPAISTALYFFGIGAFVSFAVAISACLLFDFLITKYFLAEEYNFKQSGIYVNAILLAFCLPSHIPFWIIIFGALVVVGLTKIHFHNFTNVFHPVMMAWLLLDWVFPIQMHIYPLPLVSRLSYPDAQTGITLLESYKNALQNNMPITKLAVHPKDILDLIFGYRTGSLGEISAIALVLGGFYLMAKKFVSWIIPLATILSFSIAAFALNIYRPSIYPSLLFQLLTGSILFVALFIATDSKIAPDKTTDKIVFGIGLLTIFFRCFTSVVEGTAYSVLIMNLAMYALNESRKMLNKTKRAV